MATASATASNGDTAIKIANISIVGSLLIGTVCTNRNGYPDCPGYPLRPLRTGLAFLDQFDVYVLIFDV